jgi:hypothetical protein
MGDAEFPFEGDRVVIMVREEGAEGKGGCEVYILRSSSVG